ncbi:MAG: hypothetical protein KUG78_16335 [Kangiellaceae bacterium]|nr:hypothetical protein [Kangiellaceae bacterium]
MNPKISLLIFPLLILASGCSTRVSSTHGYSHHNHVSVGVHGRSSGAAVVGALIVGGIIGSIINENEHHKDEHDSTEQHGSNAVEGSYEDYRSRSEDVTGNELTNGYSIESSIQTEPNLDETNDSSVVNADLESINNTQTSSVQWYQLGKDNKCYLMAVSSGVTDILSAVPDGKCDN